MSREVLFPFLFIIALQRVLVRAGNSTAVPLKDGLEKAGGLGVYNSISGVYFKYGYYNDIAEHFQIRHIFNI